MRAVPLSVWLDRLPALHSEFWSRAKNAIFVRSDQNVAALDGIRALAAILIVVFHCAILVRNQRTVSASAEPLGYIHQILTQCWIGVDVFFVLSGFLIGCILLRQQSSQRLSFRSFYIRRAFRIFPAYYVVLSLSLFGLSRMDTFQPLYLATPWHTLAGRAWANYLYVSNYAYAYLPTALNWGWSLCIEEHFYLFLPPFLSVLFRWVPRSWHLPVIGTLVLVPMTVRLLMFLDQPNLVSFSGPYFYTHTHCEGLLVGVMIAYLSLFHPTQLSQAVGRLGVLLPATGLVCLASVLKWGDTMRPGLFPVVFQYFLLAVGVGLVLVNGISSGNLLSRFLAHPFWYPFARLSYGIYLIHLFPLLFLLRIWPGGADGIAHSLPQLLAFAVATLGLTGLGAAVLFLGLELKMLERGRHLSARYG